MSYSESPYGMPPVVKNLLIINVLFFLGKIAFARLDINLNDIFGLHYFSSELFKPWQIVTYMFMHGNFTHLFFNMFALWMFGKTIEYNWGTKRFFYYYMICGLGAGLIQLYVCAIRIFFLSKSLPQDAIDLVYSNGLQLLQNNQNYIGDLGKLNLAINTGTVGASGSIFGLLLAFGMMFPDARIYVYFLIPIKARWFVIIYGALELIYGVTGTADGVAHFAHLGGMLFGFLLIMYWKKKKRFYS
jgi:membrane associated rhomboid family serine protease